MSEDEQKRQVMKKPRKPQFSWRKWRDKSAKDETKKHLKGDQRAGITLPSKRKAE